nr:hypothetical protein [Paludibacter sp.]
MDFKIYSATYNPPDSGISGYSGISGTSWSAWTEWTEWCISKGKLSKKIESDNPGEAGAIVLDNVNMTFYFRPSIKGSDGTRTNPVYTFFNANMDAMPRVMIKITAVQNGETEKQIFIGMIDFSSITYPVVNDGNGEYITTISFDVVEKLGAFTIISADTNQRSTDGSTSFEALFYDRMCTKYPGGSGISKVYFNREYPGILEINTAFRIKISFQTTGGDWVSGCGSDGVNDIPLVKTGETIIIRDIPYYVIYSDLQNLVSGIYDTYAYLAIPNSPVDVPQYVLEDSVFKYLDSDGVVHDDDLVKLYDSTYYDSAENYICKLTAGWVVGFDALKILKKMYEFRWGDITVINHLFDSGGNLISEFILPADYGNVLYDEYPLGKEVFDAVVELTQTIDCYLYTDADGNIVMENKNYINEKAASVTIPEQYLKIMTKNFFWDKLVDYVEVTVNSWIRNSDNTDYLDGLGIASIRANIKPRNKLTKTVIVDSARLAAAGITVDSSGNLVLSGYTDPDSNVNNANILNAYGNGIALEKLQFYGARRSSYIIPLVLIDWDMLDWTLLDIFNYNSTDFFLVSIDYDLDNKSGEIVPVEKNGVLEYSVDNIINTKSDDTYVGGSGGSISVISSGSSGGVSDTTGMQSFMDTTYKQKQLRIEASGGTVGGDVVNSIKREHDNEILQNRFEFINVYTVDSVNYDGTLLMGAKDETEYRFETTSPMFTFDKCITIEQDSSTNSVFFRLDNKESGGKIWQINNHNVSEGSQLSIGNYTDSLFDLFNISPTGKIGLLTSTPTNDLSFGNSANRKMWIENSGANTVGRDLTVAAGSTISGTNIAGGNLILQSGLGTGIGASAIFFQTGTTLGSGSTLQTMSTKMTILGDGSVGIGTTTPEGSLHVMTATAGTVTADSNADNLIVENSGNSGISILSPDASDSRIVFGSPSDSTGGQINWDYTTKVFSAGSTITGGITRLFYDNASEGLRINNLGSVGIGTIDLDGTPAIGRLTIKSSGNTSSTNVLMLRDSDEVNVAWVDSDGDGVFNGKMVVGGTVALTEIMNINGNTKQYGDIYSNNFNGVDPYTGYYIGRTGSIFDKITANELHVKFFIADLEQALAGSQIISKSVGKLYSDVTLPDYLDVSFTFDVESFEGFPGFDVFVDGDYIRLRSGYDRTGGGLTVTDSWAQIIGTATYPADPDKRWQRWTARLKHGATSVTILKGSIIPDYGQSGNGFIESIAMSALGSTPIHQISAWTTDPWSGTVIKDRRGDLTGITTTTWGALSGYGGYSQNFYAENNVYIAGNIWALTGGIGGTYLSPVVSIGNYGIAINGSGGTSAALENATIKIGNITGTANSAIKLTYTDSVDTSGLFGYTSAGEESFALRLNGTSSIGGFSFTDTKLTAGTISAGIALNTSDTRWIANSGKGFETWSPSDPRMFIGELTSDGLLSKGIAYNLTDDGSKYQDKFVISGDFYASRLSTGDTFVASGDNKSAWLESDTLWLWDGLTDANDYLNYIDGHEIALSVNGVSAFVVNSQTNIMRTQHIIPLANDTYDLGSQSRMWRKGWLSELDSVIHAINTTTVLGGWFYVVKNCGVLVNQPVTVPNPDDQWRDYLLNTDTYINVDKTLSEGDIIVMRDSAPHVEYFQLGALVAGTTTLYKIGQDGSGARNLDGSGANTWYAGQPYVVLGQLGDGRIEFSVNTTPQFSMKKQGATYNTYTELVRIGDLNGWSDYASETYGIGIGDGTHYLKYDVTNGMRFSGAVAMTNQSSISISGFDNDAGFITSGDIPPIPHSYYQSSEPTGMITGDFWFNTTAGVMRMKRYNGTSWASSPYVSVYMDTNGIYAGTITAGQIT